MGLIALLSRLSPKIGDLTLDATITESHEREAEVTDWPVEQGSDVSDHRVLLPERVVLDGVVSSAPTTFAQVVGPLAPLSVKEGFAALERLHQTQEPFDVVTRLKIYRNMLLVRLTIPRSAEIGEAVFFTAELRQIRFVSTERVAVTSDIPEAASPKVNQGTKPTKEAPPDLSQETKSVLEGQIAPIVESFFGG